MSKFSKYIKSKMPITAKTVNKKLELVETRLLSELLLNRKFILSLQDDISQLQSKVDKQTNIASEVKSYCEKLIDAININLKSIDAQLQKQTIIINNGIKDIFEQALIDGEQITNTIGKAVQTIDTFMQKKTLTINDNIKSSVDSIKETTQAIDATIQQNTLAINDNIKSSVDSIKETAQVIDATIQQNTLAINDNIKSGIDTIKETTQAIDATIQQNTLDINDNIKSSVDSIKETAQVIDATIQQNTLAINDNIKSGIDTIKETTQAIDATIQQNTLDINDNIKTNKEENLQIITEFRNEYSNHRSEAIDRLKKLEIQARVNHNAVNETVWSQVFHDTIVKSLWLKDKTFSAGRWGVGYAFFYVLYRVLNEMKPQNILELGLGESTKMIMQYAKSNSTVKHVVTEHDHNWIEFFTNNNKIPTNTEIKLLDLETSTYKNDDQVLSYANFQETFTDQKFDFICIDAPFGGKAIEYARVDVCRLLPNILSERFVVMLDDSQRRGEVNTIKEIEALLTQSNIAFASSKYRGIKEHYIVTSQDLAFLCTL